MPILKSSFYITFGRRGIPNHLLGATRKIAVDFSIPKALETHFVNIELPRLDFDFFKCFHLSFVLIKAIPIGPIFFNCPLFAHLQRELKEIVIWLSIEVACPQFVIAGQVDQKSLHETCTFQVIAPCILRVGRLRVG